MNAYIQYATGKSREMSTRIRAAMRITWVYNGGSAAEIYTGAIEPCILYAGRVRAEARNAKQSRKLMRVQCRCTVMLKAARAYAIISHKEAEVICGVQTVDIKLQKIIMRRKMRGIDRQEFTRITRAPK